PVVSLRYSQVTFRRSEGGALGDGSGSSEGSADGLADSGATRPAEAAGADRLDWAVGSDASPPQAARPPRSARMPSPAPRRPRQPARAVVLAGRAVAAGCLCRSLSVTALPSLVPSLTIANRHSSRDPVCSG